MTADSWRIGDGKTVNLFLKMLKKVNFKFQSIAKVNLLNDLPQIVNIFKSTIMCTTTQITKMLKFISAIFID